VALYAANAGSFGLSSDGQFENPMTLSTTPYETLLPEDLRGRSILVAGDGLAVTALCQARGGIVRNILDASPVRNDFVVAADIHNHRNPLAMLDQLIAATGDTLFVDVPAGRLSGASPSRFLWGAMGSFPAIALWPPGRRGSAQQAFHFTERFLLQYIKVLRQDFAIVTLHRLKSRIIVVARRRRIGELHILAGVPAIGKSTLLQKLRTPEGRDLAQRLHLDLSEPWIFATYTSLLKDTAQALDRVLVQYNFSSPLTHGPLYRYEYGILDLMQSAARIRVTTMWLPADELKARYQAGRVPEKLSSEAGFKRRRIAAKEKDISGGRKMSGLLANLGIHIRSAHIRKKTDRFMGLYSSQDALNQQCQAWLKFAEAHGADTSVLLQDPVYDVISVAEWEQRHATG
jgi:hypothetical protein